MKPRPGFLRHLAEAIAECDRQHTDDEVRQAAHALGLDDWLPEPQQPLDLPAAA